MNTPDIEHIFVHLGFLIRGCLMRLGLTQGIWREFNDAVAQSAAHNAWFSAPHIWQAMDAIAAEMLAPRKLQAWLAHYPPPCGSPQNIGIIMAGNLPLAGFHDLLCVLFGGSRAVVKLSHKDPFLLPMLKRQMVKIDYRMDSRITFVDRLLPADAAAVIAAGSDNAAAIFEEQYGHLPHIFRKGKTSAAVLSGGETAQELQGLADDMLLYFGLGCRSIAKIFVPQGCDFEALRQILSAFRADSPNFADACRYARALCIARGEPMIDCRCCILQENEALNPPVAQVFFEYYHSESDLQDKLRRCMPRLQCISSRQPICGFEGLYAGLGRAQRPQLADYADGIDVMQWLADCFYKK